MTPAEIAAFQARVRENDLHLDVLIDADERKAPAEKALVDLAKAMIKAMDRMDIDAAFREEVQRRTF